MPNALILLLSSHQTGRYSDNAQRCCEVNSLFESCTGKKLSSKKDVSRSYLVPPDRKIH